MTDLITKISAQQKIAELESRIVELEKWRSQSVTPRYTAHAADGVFGESWRKMWEHFHEVMKKL